MDNYTGKVDKIKLRLEQVIWRILAIFVPTFWGLLFTWNLFVAPWFDQYGQSISREIGSQLNAQLLSLKQVTEDHEKDITGKFERFIR